MATLTRYSGESDDDFKRRAGLWYREAIGALQENVASILPPPMKLFDRVRHRVPETFTWNPKE